MVDCKVKSPEQKENISNALRHWKSEYVYKPLTLNLCFNCFGGQGHKIHLPRRSYFSDHMKTWNVNSSGLFSSKTVTAPVVMYYTAVNVASALK